MMQTPDGRQWEVLPPAPIEHPPGLQVLNHLEWGGGERFGGKYYMDSVGQYSACETGIEDGREHSFRLLSRGGLFELDVDDLLVQTFYCRRGAGRVGFGGRNAESWVTGLRAWDMSL
jgi:hypothetical protein